MYSSDSEDGEGVAHVIHDEPVVSRALASIPTEYLTVRHSRNSKSKNVTGVFARKEIPPKTVFGPLEGTVENDDGNRVAKKLHFLVDVGGSLQRLNTTNEFLSNWMKFVKPAKSFKEQNLSLHQKGKNLYFTTIRRIRAREELKVWYSVRYASSRCVGPVFIRDPSKRPKNDWSMSCISVDYQPLLNELTEKCWTCTHCVMKFDNATLLNFHMLTHAADNIETNELAELTNEEVNFDVMNISSQNDLVDNTEDQLDYEVENPPSQAPTKDKILDCPICKAVFSKLAPLKGHVHSHAIDGLFTCPTCSKVFKSYKHIRNHIRIYHRERRFICEMCSKRFPTQDKLKHHKLSHTGHKPYLCSDCGRQFRRRDKLINHIRRFHEDPESAAKKRPRPARKKLRSRVCEGTEGSETGQPKVSPYKCEECAVHFKRRGMFVNHFAKCHPEVNPDTVAELKLPIEKPNKDYFCQYCDRVYKSTSKRKSHILKNHPGKEVPPNERESKTISAEQSGQPNELSQQCGTFIRTPHSCDWCYKQYATRAKLLQHQRQKHLDLMPKSLQEPKKTNNSKEEFDENDDLNRADEGILLLQDPLEDNLSEYESHLNDNKLCGDGEFIIDAPTLRKVLKGDALTSECSSEALAELGQILDSRPDQYFRILQTSNGISFARPVEVWDPCEPLSPEAPDSHHLLPQ